jgi:hypothetical protein
MDRPQFERSAEVLGSAEANVPGGEEVGIGRKAEGETEGPDHQGKRSVGRREVEIVDARDGLVVGGLIPVGTLGRDAAAVGVYLDVGPGGLGSEIHRSVVGNREFDEQRHRSVAGSQFDMEAKPGKEMRRGPVGGGLIVFVRILRVGNVGDGGPCVANSPGGVVEIGSLRSRIGGNADAPAFVEDQGGTQVCGVENNVRGNRLRGRFLRRPGRPWDVTMQGLKRLEYARMGHLTCPLRSRK